MSDVPFTNPTFSGCFAPYAAEGWAIYNGQLEKLKRLQNPVNSGSLACLTSGVSSFVAWRYLRDRGDTGPELDCIADCALECFDSAEIMAGR